jgi:hypothetical protein
MTQFRTRRFQVDDEVELNRLYNTVTGSKCPRSLDRMRWMWYQAPGGPLESWVIEAKQEEGRWQMVGHHGLCPMRFTFGDQDLLCAKTTNTMLLPEFRSRFLYLRFEQECLREADVRFDATYSYAPGTSRLRKPLGYEGNSTWIQLMRGVQAPEPLSRLLGHFANRYPQLAGRSVDDALAAVSAPAGRKSSLELTEYSSAEAIQAPFFEDFWDEARGNAGMSPRRDAADLAWRFWKQPGFTHTTLVHTSEAGGRAYCIVNTSNPWALRLEDIFLIPRRPDLLDALLSALFQWSARRGALLISFSTTTDGQPAEFLDVFARRMYLPPLGRFRRPGELPRRLSGRGRAKVGVTLPRWNTTSLLLPV